MASQPTFSNEESKAQGNSETVHHNKATKQWTMDLNPYLMLNSSHKQLLVFTKPVSQFVMLSKVLFLLIFKAMVASHFSLLSS